MSRPERRKKLFQLYSEHLFESLDAAENLGSQARLTDPESGHSEMVEDNTFLCPLCKKGFPLYETSSDPKEIGLTLEHVPPKTFGARLETMTCTKCNSNQGSKEGNAEKILKKRKKQEEGKATVRISFGDRQGQIEAEVDSRGDRVDFKIIEDEKRTNPDAIPELFDYLEKGAKLTVTGKSYPKLTKRQKSIFYKSAYLTMFYAFGYPYIIGDSTNPVEEQINNANENIMPTEAVIPMNGVPEGVHPPSILWLTEPFKAHLVILPLEIDNVTRPYGFILPGPQEDPDEFIAKIQETTGEALQSATLNGIYNIPERNTLELTDRFGVAASYVLWDKFTDN